MKSVKLAVTVSLLLHLMMFGTLFATKGCHNGTGPGGNGASSKRDNGADSSLEIIPKGEEAPSLAKGSVEKHEIGKLKTGRDCIGDNWFGGIGISFDKITNEVIRVFEGYPADGKLFPGDVVLNNSQILGEPGTMVTVRVRRDGEDLTFSLVRDKICVDGQKEQ